jgi:alanine-synthesizing transaminase
MAWWAVFSARTTWDLRPNPLSETVARLRASGAELLDLTTSNPTRAGWPPPQGVIEALAAPGALVYEPEAAGLRPAREAVAADYARRGTIVAPDHVLLTASTSEAYSWLFKVLCDPGDSVLVPQPSYPLFEFLARAEGVRLLPYALSYDGQWHVPRSGLAARLDASTRAVIVVSPNNPTGSFLKAGELLDLRALCEKHGLAIVSDEVFADYALEAPPDVAPSLATGDDVLAFSLGGLSKSCALPQMKLGWIAASGPRRLRDEALRRLEVVADTFLSVAAPIQHAAPALLARVNELQAPVLRRLRHNLALLRATTRGTPVTLLRTEGGWSSVLHLPALASEDAWVQDLLDDGVLVHPGYFFDFPREPYLVVSLLAPEPTFAEGTRRLMARVAARAAAR